MKNFLTPAVFLWVSFAIAGYPLTALQAELIEPTRSIKGASADPGHLTVFSEPPGLNVSLNGASVGKTPIRIKALEPGIHQLQINESVTEINIEPGKVFHISLFRNRFIIFQVAPKEPSAPSENNASPAVESRTAEAPSQQIRAKEENRQAWERWMQFVNGSSEHF